MTKCHFDKEEMTLCQKVMPSRKRGFPLFLLFLLFQKKEVVRNRD